MSAPDILAVVPPQVVGTTRLEEALTHRSAGTRHNERLEYLGDAVLGLIIAGTLYERFPDAPEGDLSRLRAALVNRQALSELAREGGLGGHVRLGQGERKSGGARRDSILSDVLEAIIGAVHLECGFEEARDFVLQLYKTRLEALPDAEQLKDPKTRLQEYLQGRSCPVPVYEVVSMTGEAHNRHFHTRCRIESLGVEAFGEGASRRIAEQEAARKALELILEKQ